VHTALEELRSNGSPNIVTMVNTLEPYAYWENLCGKGRIIPAFPGAGGSYEDGVLKADFTPPLIQATTFAEIGGNTSERLKKLASLFKTVNVPYRIAKDIFAKARGLNTSVDGVHFNSASAKILAAEIEKAALQ